MKLQMLAVSPSMQCGLLEDTLHLYNIAHTPQIL